MESPLLHRMTLTRPNMSTGPLVSISSQNCCLEFFPQLVSRQHSRRWLLTQTDISTARSSGISILSTIPLLNNEGKVQRSSESQSELAILVPHGFQLVMFRKFCTVTWHSIRSIARVEYQHCQDLCMSI